MSTIELGKAEFFTIEAFNFEYEDECFYEEERCETIDTYWHTQMGITLDDFVDEQCKHLDEEDGHVMVSIIPRKWATIVDDEVIDYGDDCMGREDYIWNGEELVKQDDYASTL